MNAERGIAILLNGFIVGLLIADCSLLSVPETSYLLLHSSLYTQQIVLKFESTFYLCPKLIYPLKNLLTQNKIFLTGCVFIFLGLSTVVLVHPRIESFVAMNPFHDSILTWFFKGVTWLGDGIFLIALALLLFFLKRKVTAILMVSTYALSGIFVQILKILVDAKRPYYFLKDSGYAHFPEGITLHSFNSFPSGHSATVFAWAAIAAFSCKDKKYGMLFWIVALVAGYSRIYLGQHFPVDVLVGSFIGLLSAILCDWTLRPYIQKVTHK